MADRPKTVEQLVAEARESLQMLPDEPYESHEAYRSARNLLVQLSDALESVASEALQTTAVRSVLRTCQALAIQREMERDAARAEVAKLREALEFYADLSVRGEHDMYAVDYGERARAALQSIDTGPVDFFKLQGIDEASLEYDDPERQAEMDRMQLEATGEAAPETDSKEEV